MEITLTVKDTVYERARVIAENSHRPIRDVLEEKLAEALLSENESLAENNDLMAIEMSAYEAMHADLVQHYLNHFVAITDSKLVDYDLDPNALMRRLRSSYPKSKVIHVTKVKPTIQKTILVRSPKFTLADE